MVALVVTYTIVLMFLPPLSTSGQLTLHFVHALLWRIYHTFFLGFVLKAQSESKYLVRHFLKHYYYPENDTGRGAVMEAFNNWKSLYNLSMCMTYGASFERIFSIFSLVLIRPDAL